MTKVQMEVKTTKVPGDIKHFTNEIQVWHGGAFHSPG